jgi:hypothetical protein
MDWLVVDKSRVCPQMFQVDIAPRHGKGSMDSAHCRKFITVPDGTFCGAPYLTIGDYDVHVLTFHLILGRIQEEESIVGYILTAHGTESLHHGLSETVITCHKSYFNILAIEINF